jgi:fibronectin-binding autotransporter adhesin
LNIGTGSGTALGTYELDAGTLSIGSAITLGSTAGGTGNLILTGGTLSSSGATLSLIDGSMSLSGTASASVSALTQTGGSYSQTAGSLTAGSANFSAATPSTFTLSGGSMTINGGTWTPFKQTVLANEGTTNLTVANAWTVAGSGNPSLTLQNGATASGVAGVVGFNNLSGALNVSDSTMTLTGAFDIAEGATNSGSTFTGSQGTVNVSSGANLSVFSTSVGGFGGTGTLNIQSGSTMTSNGGFTVGVNAYNTAATGIKPGNGILNVTGGSVLNTTNASIAIAGSIGTVNVGISGQTDTGSTLNSTLGIFVGGGSNPSNPSYGLGTLNIYPGAAVTAKQMTIFDGTSTAYGTVNVNGGTATIGTNLNIGNSSGAQLAALNVTNGGVVNASQVSQTSGNINVSGGSLNADVAQNGGNFTIGAGGTVSAANFQLNGGNFSQTGGSLTATDNAYFLGADNFSFTGGTITVGGIWSPFLIGNTNTWAIGAAPASDVTLNLEAALGISQTSGEVGQNGGTATLNIIGASGSPGFVSLAIGDGGSGTGHSFSPSHGTLNFTGNGFSNVNFGNLVVGLNGGVGNVVVQNEPEVILSGVTLGQGTSASGTQSSGTLIFNSTDASADVDDEGIDYIGTNGGVGVMTIGQDINIRPRWFNSTAMYVGGNPSNPNDLGTGTLNIVGTVLTPLLVASNSATTSGTINLKLGGTLQVGILTLGQQSDLNWASGTLDITNMAVTIGPTGLFTTQTLLTKTLETPFGTTTIAPGGSVNVSNGFFSGGTLVIDTGGSVTETSSSRFNFSNGTTVYGSISMGNGQIGEGPLMVSNGGSINDGGTIFSATTVSAGGTIAPGDPAIQTYLEGLDLSGGGTYDWQLASPPKDNSTGTAGTDFDQVQVTGGNLKLGGTSNFNVDTNLLSAGDQPDGANHNAFWNSSHIWTVAQVSGSGTNSGGTNFDTVANGAYFRGDFATQLDADGKSVDLVYNELNITAGAGNNTSLGKLTLSGAAGKYLPVSMAIGEVNSGTIDVAGLNPPNDSPLLVLMDVKGTPAAITQWSDELEGNQTGGVAGYTMQSISNAAQFGTTIPAGDTGFLLTFNNVSGSSDRFINFDWSAGNSGVLLDEVTVVPEPTALALITLSSAGLLLRRHRRPRAD